MRRMDRGPRSLPDDPPSLSPLTAWKLRYKASSMRDVDSIVILPAPCIAYLLQLPACLRTLVFASPLYPCAPSPIARNLLFLFVSLSPAHHVIGRESSPHPSRCSRRVVRAHSTATTPALTRTGQAWRCRTLIRERRAHTCAHLEGMLYSSLCPSTR